MHIDLGKMPEKSDGCCGGEIAKSPKPKKYYPTSYMDDVGNIKIDDLPIEKDITVEMVIRITSAKKRETKDKNGSKITVDINYEMRSIDFKPGDKKKNKAADGDSIHEAIMEALPGD